MSDVRVEYYNQTAETKQDIKAQWWREKDSGLFSHMFGVVNSIETQQSWRYLNNIRYARLYANYELLGFYGTMFSQAANMPLNNSRLTLNVTKACIDTAAAKIAKNRPRPLFLTSGGDWSEQRRAQKLTKYVEGAFEAANVYKKGPLSFTDAGIMGTGILKIYPDKEKAMICVDRVLTDEIVVDDADGMYGEPRTMYHRKYVDRDVLCEMFPDYEKEIRAATIGVKGDSQSATSANLIKVIEGWHLRSGESAKDGIHAICIENATLLKETWSKDYFPFAVYRWSPKIVGFWGGGLAEELVGIQLEINKTLRTIQKSIDIACVPRVWLENSAKVNSAHITNEIGSIGKYTGTPPVFNTAQALSPEVYSHLQNLYNKAFEITGVSQMSATSQKPKGLDSAVAMREYQDIETERFVLAGQRYEEFFMDIAQIVVDQSRDLYEELKKEKRDLSVKVKGSKFIETIKWKDVDMENDKFIMRVYPTSLLPNSPQGRLQRVQELMQAGFIDKEVGMSLLDFPDIESYMSLQTAAIDDIKMIIENMIEEGDYQVPEPQMNLGLALKMVQSAYLRGKTDSVPEDRLELLRRFMDDCNEILNMAQPPAPPPMPPPIDPMMPGGVPIADPMAPPQSDLLPVV
jgi:hypothetical protein